MNVDITLSIYYDDVLDPQYCLAGHEMIESVPLVSRRARRVSLPTRIDDAPVPWTVPASLAL